MPSGSRDDIPSPFVLRVLVIAVLLTVPFRVVAHGYVPTDDALRHAAKILSGKPWSEILVLRPEITMDSHPGWHAILGAFHTLAGADGHSMVMFSVIGLFTLFALLPALLLRRPESWLLSLSLLAVADPGVLSRLFQGRPFIASMAAVVLLCLLWRRLREEALSWWTAIALTLAFAAATWIHGSPFLFVVPLLCFFLAGEHRAGARVATCLAIGVLLGASLTGSPIGFVWQSILHAYLAVGTSDSLNALAIEFHPFVGSPLMVTAILGFLGWRSLRGSWSREHVRNPVLLLAATGWVLGYVAIRFWSDWGMPAALVWMALELQDLFEEEIEPNRTRLALIAALGATTFLSITADAAGRWSGAWNTRTYLGPLSAQEEAHRPWLPEAGGIFYTTDMRLFYRTFYLNPDAPWRYIVGYEPGIMPPEDLAVYRAVLNGRGDPEPLREWVRKMRASDRLFLVRISPGPPPVEGLEWHEVLEGLWSGRLPPESK